MNGVHASFEFSYFDKCEHMDENKKMALGRCCETCGPRPNLDVKVK